MWYEVGLAQALVQLVNTVCVCVCVCVLHTHRYIHRRRLRGLTVSALDHRSLPLEFESRHGHNWRVFHLWLRFITFGGRAAHLAYHVHKSGHKTSITNHRYTKKQTMGGVVFWYIHCSVTGDKSYLSDWYFLYHRCSRHLFIRLVLSKYHTGCIPSWNNINWLTKIKDESRWIRQRRRIFVPIKYYSFEVAHYTSYIRRM